MNNSYYHHDANGSVGGNDAANMNNYQSASVSSRDNDTTAPYETTKPNDTTGLNDTSNKQGQSTGAEGNGPDFICRILDKLEKKFGGERFNNPDNDAKNLAMNQKMSARIKTIGPTALRKLPQIISMIVNKAM